MSCMRSNSNIHAAGVIALLSCMALASPLRLAGRADRTKETSVALPPSRCDLAGAVIALRCASFDGNTYAVADIDLQMQKIVFSSTDRKMEAYPRVVEQLQASGLQPLLLTNGGIYGTDARPLGLLITPKGKEHDVNLASGHGGNFSWDSAVFQVSDQGTASIVLARDYGSDPQTVAATQSGPRLAAEGKVNSGFSPQSRSFYLRTAVGVDGTDRRVVHLVVSESPVTLFELATFMVSELHCSEALHLDGDLSAFYVPVTRAFVFRDPGERIVTVLSVVARKAK
jgi:uncharacterized protein YigE (DUF2233 family)